MNSILPDQYYIHVFLLIKSIRILLSCSISEDELQLAETLLKKFCSGMEKLNGKLIASSISNLANRDEHYIV